MNAMILPARAFRFFGAAVCFLMLTGCASTRDTVREAPAPAGLGRLAILEFENLTDQPNAAQAVAGILRVELQSRGISLVPESAVSALASKKMDVAELARQNQFDKIGAAVGADHLLVGRVTEYHYRHGLTEQSVVGFTIQAVSAKTGIPVWSATFADRGAASFTGGESLTEVTRRICQKAADRLSASK